MYIYIYIYNKYINIAKLYVVYLMIELWQSLLGHNRITDK